MEKKKVIMDYNKFIKSTVAVLGRLQFPAPGYCSAGAKPGSIYGPLTERNSL